MTENESKEFLKQAFIAFPGISAWVDNTSIDPPGTIALWVKALEQITITEAHSVLTRWVTGALPAPSAYHEKEMFPQHIIAIVKRDRSEARSKDNRKETLRKHTGQSIFRDDPIFGPYITNILRIIRQYNAGDLTTDERNHRIAELERDAIKLVETKPTRTRFSKPDWKQAAVST
jgi:hypothetical protein